MLIRVRKQVDPRYISALMEFSLEQSKAVFLENIKGYHTSVVGGIIGSRRMVTLAFKTTDENIIKKFKAALEKPIEPKIVANAPVKDVIVKGEEVDLTKFPIPLLHEKDGAPYISASVLTSKDFEYGRNAGVYRMMFKEKDKTGIDLVSSSVTRIFYERMLNKNRPLEVAVAIGTHPCDFIAASYMAPTGVDEWSIAGALRGEPVELVKCETVDVEVPAHAEIILEGELLPIGWTEDEGRFGEGTSIMGTVHRNPVIKIKAITYRKDAIFQVASCQNEGFWADLPAYEVPAWDALKAAGVEAKAVNITLPGTAMGFHIIASLKNPRPGESKNALLALLSTGLVKHAVVTDEDINIFDPAEVEWAIATRVQADKDVIIISGCRAKALDPSLGVVPGAALPVTSKLGIDATIPPGIPKEWFSKVKYPYKDKIRLEEFLED